MASSILPPRSIHDLRAKYRHLVWSNPDHAGDDIYLIAVLRRASFYEVLDFVNALGLPTVRRAWEAWKTEAAREVAPIAPEVERILGNIQAARAALPA